MEDNDCIRFLQWLLPQFNMRWKGFRKVRRQVCKRIDRRIRELKLSGCSAYRDYLADHPMEWKLLDGMCRITISRFYRDRSVFSRIGSDLLPRIIDEMSGTQERTIRIWSAGCASGEEPYTLALLHHILILPRHQDVRLELIATDSDPAMIRRAEAACYQYSSLRELPSPWVEQAFDQVDKLYYLKNSYKKLVRFVPLDIRTHSPAGRFHMILCRNLAFTYFDEDLQLLVLQRFHEALKTAGMMICGIHEQLPANELFTAWHKNLPVFQKKALPVST